MKSRNLFVAAILGTSGLVSHLHDPALAVAQSGTTGAVQGVIKDEKGDALTGVTVIVTSPSLSQTQTAITDDKGFYSVGQLPAGDYLVTFYYADKTIERSGIHVGIGKSTPVYQTINTSEVGGETIKIQDTAPTIDPTSTTQGITIDKNYLKNIPVPGRTFESALGAAAGSQGDGVGISFSGSSSLENQYYVDGVNTTGLTYGTVGSPVINDFIEEIEVITGGYNAEYGRATGGVVNVVTKSGSNEFKGSVFGYWQPGFLTASSNPTPQNATSIDVNANTTLDADFGFEIGGPIIKDKLWFFVGFAPAFNRVDYTRITKRQTDCRFVMPDGSLSTCDRANADTEPDIDPESGFYITDTLDSEIRTATQQTYNTVAKINYAATPEHQGQLGVQAQPASGRSPRVYGQAGQGTKFNILVTDVSAKWTSKLNDNKTEIEAVVGWHRESYNSDSIDPSVQNDPYQVLINGDLSNWGPGFGESATTNAGCADDASPSGSDPYPFITNCPMDVAPYVIGGPGNINRDVEERRAAKLNITQRLKAGGSHEIKAGMDVENNISNKARLYSGGAFITNFVGPGQVYVNRWVQLASDTETDPRFDNICSTPDPNAGGGATNPIKMLQCDFLSGTPGSPGTTIAGNTLNWSAYLRDSWQIRPNLTLNAGLRYEEQRLRYAEFLRGKLDPLTDETLGTNAMTLTGNWSPRIGLLYDWTKEGRSKVYTHWGRFYESVPMDINDRSFGGEVFYRQGFAAGACGPVDDQIGGPNGVGCTTTTMQAQTNELLGASGVLVAPGIQSQYMDELIAGFEYEVMDDLKIGVSYQNRRMGRVIEDVSTDGAQTYIIANPGEWSEAEEAKLVDRINRTDDPSARARLENQLKLYQGIRIFDKPRRDYNALQFTLTRRFSKKLYVQGSYTYSRVLGNYPGLISYDNGQVDPNISSQYDLIELLGNRLGPQQTDRPHYIKLDGYYTFDLKKAGELTTGVRFRALSGVPTNALAAHYLYGSNESFLLPRGQLGRTDFEHGLDIHVGYKRKLPKEMTLEVFVDIYNSYNRQGTFGVDTTYGPQFSISQGGAGGVEQNANPVSGGTYEDLLWVKVIDRDGVESAAPLGRNPNFRNTNSRYAPAYGRFGMRLTF